MTLMSKPKYPTPIKTYKTNSQEGKAYEEMVEELTQVRLKTTGMQATLLRNDEAQSRFHRGTAQSTEAKKE